MPLTNLSDRSRRMVWCVLFLALVGVAGVYAQDRLSELRLPLAFYPDGALKAELQAKDAEIQSETRFKGKEVRYRSYTPAGEVDVQIDAADAVVNQTTMTASSEGAVKLVKDGVEVSGVGFDWYGNEEKVTIKSQARVVFERGQLGSLTAALSGQKEKKGSK